MKTLHETAADAVQQLADFARQQAVNAKNHADLRFRSHQARDKYREALSLIQQASELLPEAQDLSQHEDSQTE